MEYFQIGGYTFGLLAVGVAGGLVTWWLEDALITALSQKKWILPILGAFAAMGASVILFTKYLV